VPDDRMFTDAEALLVTRNAQNLEHPGGTLLEHAEVLDVRLTIGCRTFSSACP